MSNRFILIGLLLAFIGCNHTIDKPDNLIEKDKMIDILYDISLLEAIKSQNISGGISNNNANTYLYKKYKIDSIQFAQSNKYYASDIEEYKKMFEEVKSRLEKQIQKIGGNPNEVGAPINPETPQVQ
ncbi:DUF4296 domain-containing protein [Flavobacterium sp. 102]|uniref:DUF4296 domain-containing protein n=1 Tax=Flavobacterium sp. 102 TaxID=2135623 RepID=UPI000EAE1EBD|nr:DUF4296 domain-containing protein [Flavobacterium sp. 102]RKS01399.1 uncharacterized protein DUF4296 [Flavobacterium sp. 102]